MKLSLGNLASSHSGWDCHFVQVYKVVGRLLGAYKIVVGLCSMFTRLL